MRIVSFSFVDGYYFSSSGSSVCAWLTGWLAALLYFILFTLFTCFCDVVVVFFFVFLAVVLVFILDFVLVQ